MARHVWRRDAEGYVEIYGDQHAGPECVVCGAHECESCRPEFLGEDCPEREAQDTLPGLEYG